MSVSPEIPKAIVLDSGSEGDFKEIFLTYQDRIYNCVYRLTGNPEDANDLTQDTFVRAYGSLPKIKGELKVGPWLYRIATNLYRDQARRRRMVQMEPLEAPSINPQLASGRVFDTPRRNKPIISTNRYDDPEQAIALSETTAQVRNTLEKLPPKYRACLVLQEYRGMSCEEIAVVLGSTRSAVKSLLFRAREEFRVVHARLNQAPRLRD